MALKPEHPTPPFLSWFQGSQRLLQGFSCLCNVSISKRQEQRGWIWENSGWVQALVVLLMHQSSSCHLEQRGSVAQASQLICNLCAHKPQQQCHKTCQKSPCEGALSFPQVPAPVYGLEKASHMLYARWKAAWDLRPNGHGGNITMQH